MSPGAFVHDTYPPYSSYGLEMNEKNLLPPKSIDFTIVYAIMKNTIFLNILNITTGNG